jgi:integrase/recombinase XerD
MNKNENQNIHESILTILSALENQQTAQSTIKNYRYGFNVFEKYLKENSITEVNEKVCLYYIHHKTGKCPESFCGDTCDSSLNRQMKPLHLLLLYLKTGDFCYEPRKKSQEFICPDNFREEYSCFIDYLHAKGLSKLGIDTNIRHVQKILTFLNLCGYVSLDMMTVADMEDYLCGYEGCSLKYLGTIMYVMRNFFSFLYRDGFLTEDISPLFPKVRVPRSGGVPYAWKTENIQKLLGAVDREDPAGKRNYAILLLTMHTGLRAGDIRNLRLKDIDWSRKIIHIIMGKTKQPLDLPLLADVGWAIIDYLKNGRPQTSCDCVFTRHKAPFGPIGGTAALDKAINRYMMKAGLNTNIKDHHGMHSLRSTLARNMLDSGAPLPIISQTLGHRDINTTSIYLKIDIEGLRKCALETEEVLLHDEL